VRTAGWGGLKAVARITGLARSTINRGEDDLDGEPLPEGQVRREGGGRKPVAVTDPETRKLSGRDEPHHRHLEVSETGAACMHKLVYMLLVAVPLAKLDAASACYMTNQPSDEELFAKASTVFVGHIFRAEEIEIQIPVPGGADTRPAPAIEGTFRLVEVLKGEPPADRKVISFIPMMCVQWLEVGFDYLIFLNEGSNMIVSPGTQTLRPLSEKPSTNDLLCQDRECVLGKLRDLSKKAQ